MKKSVVYSLIMIFVLGILGGCCAIYYSFQEDDITKLNWTGTTYLAKGEWGNVIAYKNIFSEGVKATNDEQNSSDVLVQVLDHKGAIIVEPTPLAAGETITFPDIPWNSGTIVIQAKTMVEGNYKFEATNQKVLN